MNALIDCFYDFSYFLSLYYFFRDFVLDLTYLKLEIWFLLYLLHLEIFRRLISLKDKVLLVSNFDSKMQSFLRYQDQLRPILR